MSETIRPTKKQRELLTYIEQFITEHGYSPSFREIMVGLNYNSVATVALHINNLIKRGHLRKRDHSARSLEVAKNLDLGEAKTSPAASVKEHKEWLVTRVEQLFKEAEANVELGFEHVEHLQILVSALKVLHLNEAFLAYSPRLEAIKVRVAK